MSQYQKTNYPGVVYYQGQNSKDKIFYVTFKDAQGKLIRRKIGKASEGFSALKASQMRGDMINDTKHGGKAEKYKVYTVQQITEMYLRYRKAIVSEQIYNGEINYLKRFIDYFGAEIPIASITSAQAQAMIAHLRGTKALSKGQNSKATDKPLSNQTILHHFNTYSRLFKYSIKNGHYIGQNPFDEDARKVIPKLNNKLVRYFTDEQNKDYVKTLFADYSGNKTQEFIRNVLGMYYASGMRRGEVFNLTLEDIDFERDIVRLKDPKSQEDKYLEVSHIAMYFIKSQIAAKKRYHVESEYIFCTRYGTKRTELQTQFNTFKKRAGLPANFRLHDLRHNFATLAATAGYDLHTIQKLLTHADPKTTQRYAHLVDGTISKAANKALEGIELPPLKE